MKVKILTPTVHDIKYLKVKLSYPMLEDWEINNCSIDDIRTHPFYSGEHNLEFSIELETGKVLGWKQGDTLSTCDKVCDQGEYWLYDSLYNEVIESNSRYVPKMLDTKGDGYGDYIQFDIDENGYIKNWKIILDDFNCVWVS